MKNLYQLSDAEIVLIHALTFFGVEGMTPQAQKLNDKLKKQFLNHKVVGSFQVWKGN